MYDLKTDTEKREELVGLLESALGKSRNHYPARHQIAFDCPQCSYNKGVDYDGKGNLEINYKSGSYNCWACGEEFGTHGSIRNLFKRWSDANHLTAFDKLKVRFSYMKDDEEVEYTQKVDEILKLPEEYFSLTQAPNIGNFKQYFDYLTARGITADLIEKFKIGCCLTGKYAGRVVLPSYSEEGDLEYFVTRSIYKWKKKFKYMNCAVKKETIIFNGNMVDWEKMVFIVEGPMDHIVLPNSIPLLGKKMSDLLFSTLYQNAEASICLILDPEAWERTKQIYNKLDGGKLMGRVFAVKMPKDEKGKDIDVSKYNELFGQQALFEYIKKNMIKLLD